MKIGYLMMTTHLESSTHRMVEKAVKEAKIPSDCLRECKDWAAFKRAVNMLVKSGKAETALPSKDRGDRGILRDKIEDDEDKIEFQLSAKWLASKGINYSRVQIIRFYKEDGKIECETPAIRRVVDELLDEARLLMNTTDIHKVAARFCAQHFRRILLKDGIYFIPLGHDAVIQKLKTFYRALGANLWCNQVTEGLENTENVLRCVVDDIKTTIDELQDKMNLQRTKKTGVSKEVARNAMDGLKDQMAHYRDIARSIRQDATDLIRKAGKSSDILLAAELGTTAVIEMARGGQPVNALAIELAEAAEETSVAAVKTNIRAIPTARPMPKIVSRNKKRSKVIPLPSRNVAAVAQR